MEQLLRWRIRYAIAVLVLAVCLNPNGFPTLWLRLDRSNAAYTIGHNPALAVLAVIAVFASWLSFAPVTRGSKLSSMLWMMSGVYLAALALGLAVGFREASIVCDATEILASFGSGLIIARLCGSARSSLSCIAVITCVVAIQSVVGFLSGHHIFVSGSLRRAGGPYDSPMELGYLLAIALPIVIWFANEVESGVVAKFLSLFGAGIAVAALLMTFSRGAISAGAAAVAGLAYTRGGMLGRLVPLAVFLAVFVGVNHVRSQDPTNSSSTINSNTGHLRFAEIGLEVARQNWLMGVGPGVLSTPLPPRSANRLVSVNAGIHESSIPVVWLDEFGIGGLALLAFIVYLVVGILRTAAGEPVSRPLAASWTALAICGLFDAPFGTELQMAPTVLVGILLGATLLLARECNETADAARPNTAPDLITKTQ